MLQGDDKLTYPFVNFVKKNEKVKCPMQLIPPIWIENDIFVKMKYKITGQYVLFTRTFCSRMHLIFKLTILIIAAIFVTFLVRNFCI